MTMRLDDKDVIILTMIRDNSSVSYTEIVKSIHATSVGTASNRMRKLEELGLVEKPAYKKQARSRFLTNKGKQYLREILAP